METDLPSPHARTTPSPSDFQDFSILLERVGGECRARVAHASGDSAPLRFDPPFDLTQLDDALEALQSRITGAPTKRPPPTDVPNPRAFGEILYRRLISGGVREALAKRRQAAFKDGKGLRLRLVLDANEPQLAALPWELLFDPDGRQFVAHDPWTPIVRYLKRPVSIDPNLRSIHGSLRVLVIDGLSGSGSGQDDDDGDPSDDRIDAEREIREIRTALSSDPEILPSFARVGSYDELHRLLQHQRPHVLHVMGHGTFDATSGEGSIFLLGEGSKATITGKDLAVLVRGHKQLRLVVLSACRGAEAPRRKGLSPFSGVASSLVLRAELPAVVAMQFPISTDAAGAFSRGFYPSLARREPVEVAVAEGRKSIYGVDRDWGSFEWSTPVVYLSVDHGSIFARDPSDRTRRAERAVHIARLPSTGQQLFGREEELRALDEAWDDSNTRILSLIAWGGVGKTSLVNRWLQQMEADDFRGALRVYGWSFYRQGTSSDGRATADDFLDHALRRLGAAESDFRLPPWDRGTRLADIATDSPTLMVLDGLEPLQYPQGELHGKLRDKSMVAFFKQAARLGPRFLCVVTSRVDLTDLDMQDGHTLKTVQLSHLSPDAGARLLSHLGVWAKPGEQHKILEVARDLGGHALALTLLGRYLDVVYGGDVRKVELIPGLMEEQDLGGHARRVIAAYRDWLQDKKELGILYLMGLFDRPAPAEALEALHLEEIFQKLEVDSEVSEAGWKYAVRNLRRLSLLAQADDFEPDSLDCHPLIREYFSDAFKSSRPEIWTAAHHKLFDYYRSRPTEHRPESLPQLEPLFAAVMHGCEAGLYRRALDDIFLDRINHNQSYSTKVIGAFGANLAALSGFFERRWDRPVPELSSSQQMLVLNRASLCLSALGHIRESIAPSQEAVDRHLEREDWLGAAKNAANLKEFYLKLGDIPNVVKFARLSLEAADKTDRRDHQISRRTTLGNALHLGWDVDGALAAFNESERLQRKHRNQKFLDGLNGIKFVSLLIDLQRFDEAQERLDRMFRASKKSGKPSLVARFQHYQALLLTARAKQGQTVDHRRALELFDQAVDSLRLTGRDDTLPYPLMERAVLKGMMNDVDGAWLDLQEADEISTRGEMVLNRAHIHFVSAELLIREGRGAEATEHLHQAERLIEKTGYLRGRLELERLRGLLGTRAV